MGGDLTVDSQLGQGTCFTIRVPSRPGNQEAADTAVSGGPSLGFGLGMRQAHA